MEEEACFWQTRLLSDAGRRNHENMLYLLRGIYSAMRQTPSINILLSWVFFMTSLFHGVGILGAVGRTWTVCWCRAWRAASCGCGMNCT